ncbi:MAG TPA: peptide-methionine (S)-S-oxide reductase MsrA [Rhodocyclaceae bacterium]
METAILGGGCFWCLEAALGQLEGVASVVSGYCGGHYEDPSYEEVCSGDSGHAEVVKVEFDPAAIDYRTLLQAFFAIHDPTTLDRQGNDVGSQYRSVIFALTPEQEREAHRLIGELTADRVWPRPIVTRIQRAGTFWPAEEYHQRYFARNPRQPYCIAVVEPKVAKLRQKFAGRIKAGSGS